MKEAGALVLQRRGCGQVWGHCQGAEHPMSVGGSISWGEPPSRLPQRPQSWPCPPLPSPDHGQNLRLERGGAQKVLQRPPPGHEGQRTGSLEDGWGLCSCLLASALSPRPLSSLSRGPVMGPEGGLAGTPWCGASHQLPGWASLLGGCVSGLQGRSWPCLMAQTVGKILHEGSPEKVWKAGSQAGSRPPPNPQCLATSI